MLVENRKITVSYAVNVDRILTNASDRTPRLLGIKFNNI